MISYVHHTSVYKETKAEKYILDWSEILKRITRF
jgi:hypothetical protein